MPLPESQQSEKGNTQRCGCNTPETLENSFVCHVISRPLIILLDNLIFGVSCHWGARILFLTVKLHRIEVVVLCLIPIRKVPEYSDVFKAQVVPFIVVRVVWHRVFVNILSFEPAACDSNEFSFVDLRWSASLISVLGRNPTSVHDNC